MYIVASILCAPRAIQEQQSTGTRLQRATVVVVKRGSVTDELDLLYRARSAPAMSRCVTVTETLVVSCGLGASLSTLCSYGHGLAFAMKPRLPLSLRLPFSRSYATRLPERPPYRAPDPLRNNPHATYQELADKNLTFIHRPPPTAPSPLSYTTSPASPLHLVYALPPSRSSRPTAFALPDFNPVSTTPRPGHTIHSLIFTLVLDPFARFLLAVPQ
ncbi:hypothetical protein NUW54_g11257 [Trametes sanguinea]|uniref:Uncharacterized protein n=1 Tax=Trametes sanguinea TaxID=158606 RepID=A0ACC1NIK5_9APHY|nr:hypothetical protein NUW54_g11257 [Trametes sanguinea]